MACPIGSYCDLNSTTCEPTLPSGSTCLNDENCNYGFSCVKDPITLISRCVQDLSVLDGTPVSIMGGIQSPSVCKSFNLFYSDSKQTYYCMPANTSNMNYEIGYPSGSKCTYKFFTNPQKLDSNSVESVTARCGFNKDTLSYCP